MSSEMPAAPCGLPSPPIPSLRSARVGRAAHCPLRETSRRRGSFVSSEMPAAPCGLPSPPIPSLRSARVGRAAHCPLRETSRRRGSFVSSEMPAAPCGLPSPPIPSLRSARVGRAAHCPLRETSRRRGSFVSSEMPAAPCGLPSPPIPSLRSARIGRAAHYRLGPVIELVPRHYGLSPTAPGLPRPVNSRSDPSPRFYESTPTELRDSGVDPASRTPPPSRRRDNRSTWLRCAKCCAPLRGRRRASLARRLTLIAWPSN